MSSFNTQPVMTSGIQTKSPAIRYLRMRLLFLAHLAGFVDAGAGVLAAGVGETAGAVDGVAGDAVSVFASLFVSDLVSAVLFAAASGLAASVFASGAGFFPSRKSVTYQPLPFN